SLSRATGANSVVVKMNAARARAITPSQLPWGAVSAVVIKMEPNERKSTDEGGRRGRGAFERKAPPSGDFPTDILQRVNTGLTLESFRGYHHPVAAGVLGLVEGVIRPTQQLLVTGV